VQAFRSQQLIAQGQDQVLGDHRDPVLAALAFPDDDLAALEVEILDPKAQSLDHTHAGAVKKTGDQPARAVQRLQQRLDLLAGQDHWQAARTLR